MRKFLRKALFVVLVAVGFIGSAISSFALLVAISSTIPDCGPWLSGEEYVACKDTPVGPEGIVFVYIFGAMAISLFFCWMAIKIHFNKKPAPEALVVLS